MHNGELAKKYQVSPASTRKKKLCNGDVVTWPNHRSRIFLWSR